MFLKKINLIAPNPKGCKLIFNTPFRACPELVEGGGANVENQYSQI
jgi:hypothetical protein